MANWDSNHDDEGEWRRIIRAAARPDDTPVAAIDIPSSNAGEHGYAHHRRALQTGPFMSAQRAGTARDMRNWDSNHDDEGNWHQIIRAAARPDDTPVAAIDIPISTAGEHGYAHHRRALQTGPFMSAQRAGTGNCENEMTYSLCCAGTGEMHNGSAVPRDPYLLNAGAHHNELLVQAQDVGFDNAGGGHARIVRHDDAQGESLQVGESEDHQHEDNELGRLLDGRPLLQAEQHIQQAPDSGLQGAEDNIGNGASSHLQQTTFVPTPPPIDEDWLCKDLVSSHHSQQTLTQRIQV